MRYIHDGDSIILDAGSTVLQMVPLLSHFNNITVMTNSLHIVNALSEFDNEQTILMPGGTFRKKVGLFSRPAGGKRLRTVQLRQAVYGHRRYRSERRSHYL